MKRKKIRSNCILCGREVARPTYKYCSNTCQQQYQQNLYIACWKKGEISGLQALGTVSNYIKNYLRTKFGNCCCLCGWAEVNPKSKLVPLVADHIDGNWRNNIDSNLRLICPNCDSLSPTYAALNRGNGRVDRVISKRAKEGRKLMKKNK
ncbi:MAG: HNH endonuclease [Candidatus Harrisonbacteria bacterium CG10_big_fil_rev_8_21_14_0_10_45_28]|uniref:HNH endonuclease n=1 Tax=Candidatus Harrisonbacteria bacterium CG10_big_fil_rev_8_21_14_0_10_45_28 TaxID=1974586 RepID=A0A2H0UP15_9BACT|nr:MAG: HNH endonuclease [Candidatus Harrisonbacteria bacterium CG10_big_fil_rev_8_21_14_0_10_45_28]